jgi:hypothetical protein
MVDVPHALLAMFRIFCGSRAQLEKECWLAAGPTCVIVTYPVTILGNFMIGNMFLAVLLAAFNPENLKRFDKVNKDPRIKKEVQRFKRWFKMLIDTPACKCCKSLPCFRKSKKVTPDDMIGLEG